MAMPNASCKANLQQFKNVVQRVQESPTPHLQSELVSGPAKEGALATALSLLQPQKHAKRASQRCRHDNADPS